MLLPLMLMFSTSTTLKLASFALMSPVIIAFPETCNFSSGLSVPIPKLPLSVIIR